MESQLLIFRFLQIHIKNVTINSSISCNSSFSVSGNWSNTGTFTSSSSANTITFMGNSNQSITGGTINAKRIVFNNTDTNSDLDIFQEQL